MHPTLQEQIQSHLPDELTQLPEISSLLDAIDSTYHDFESDLILLEQHMERSSDDLYTVNVRLKTEATKHQQAIQQLKNNLSQLNIDSDTTVDEDDLLSISAFLSKQIELRQQSETDLRKAKDDAEIAAKTKTEFLATMSHEIRTPLNGVIGMTSLLANTSLSDDQLHYLETIQTCSHSLMNLVNDILDVSKFDTGKIQLERTPFSPRSSIEQTLQVVAERAQTKNLHLVSYISSDIPSYLIGDSGRIHQILLNLLSNSVKFTDEGSILISASQAEASKGSAKRFWITFTIKDTGIGISKSQQKNLFKPFVQADSTTTRKYGGTGLGLTLCKQLATLMGGTIDVYSKPNQGSEFTVTLPLRTSPSTDKAPWESHPLPAKRVMLIEDNKTSAKAIHAQLEHWGLNIYTATRSDNAIKILRKGKFDALIIDNDIDNQHADIPDGISLLDRIRHYGANLATIPTLLLLNLSEKTDDPIFSNDCTHHIAKPLESHQLYNKLASFLMEHSSQHSPQPQTIATESRWIPHYELRVLVVEDDLVNQEISSMMLKELNCHVDIASDGHEAVTAVKSHQYDLVLMDCQMPDMDGYEATRVIRKLGFTELPIVALTANAMPTDEELCLACGMNAYLTKPIKSTTLAETLKQWAPSTAHILPPKAPSERPIASTANQSKISTGIMFDQGLDMMGGKLSRYITLLGLAVEQHHDSPNNIAQAIDNADFETAQKLAHSLKSVGANIGATQLSVLAFSIEHQIRESSTTPSIPEQDVSQLQQEWINVKSAIEAYITDNQQ
ncbi:hypothetical protein A9Q99_05220 [Gammaproteobacteria bacterium 45_16_T64]|mgnify:CR=1 FL=1|nr:hypothetical protein A9Q99_05220 [Gammaproteobacteria bacterium 45_16_T64]